MIFSSASLALLGGLLRRGLRFPGLLQAGAQGVHQVNDVARRCLPARGDGLPLLLFREQFGQRGLVMILEPFRLEMSGLLLDDMLARSSMSFVIFTS